MITKIDSFIIECDNCGEHFENYNTGFSIFSLESDAREQSSEEGWHEDKEKNYCPDCHDFDSNDELIINTKIQ